eukprot:5291064-Pyramimonas_sp.AAC.1
MCSAGKKGLSGVWFRSRCAPVSVAGLARAFETSCVRSFSPAPCPCHGSRRDSFEGTHCGSMSAF